MQVEEMVSANFKKPWFSHYHGNIKYVTIKSSTQLLTRIFWVPHISQACTFQENFIF